MIAENIPIGNSSRVMVWNTITTRYADRRVLGHSKKPAIVVSNRNPAQLKAQGAHGCWNTTPRTGMSVFDPSQMLSGCAWSNQSGCALAKPAKV
jgi:hypothetical protein